MGAAKPGTEPWAGAQTPGPGPGPRTSRLLTIHYVSRFYVNLCYFTFMLMLCRVYTIPCYVALFVHCFYFSLTLWYALADKSTTILFGSESSRWKQLSHLLDFGSFLYTIILSKSPPHLSEYLPRCQILPTAVYIKITEIPSFHDRIKNPLEIRLE